MGTKVEKDQFIRTGAKFVHTPTGAEFTAGSDYVNWGRVGEILPNGDDFEKEDVARVAAQFIAESFR